MITTYYVEVIHYSSAPMIVAFLYTKNENKYLFFYCFLPTWG